MDELIRDFENKMHLEGKSEKTIKIYVASVKEFFRWFNDSFGDVEFKKLYRENILEYKSYLKNVKICKRTGQNLNAKDFLADTDINSEISDEETKKSTYIHMFTGMGYDKSKVEKIWNSLEKLMKQFEIPFEKAMGCMIYALKYDCGIEIPLRNICGINVGLVQKSIPVYQKEMVKCFGIALAGGLVYLLADSLSKEWE